MYAAIVFLPLLGAVVAGLFGRIIGDRIAQLVVCQVEKIEWQSINKPTLTERGIGGLGSTGTK